MTVCPTINQRTVKKLRFLPSGYSDVRTLYGQRAWLQSNRFPSQH